MPFPLIFAAVVTTVSAGFAVLRMRSKRRTTLQTLHGVLRKKNIDIGLGVEVEAYIIEDQHEYSLRRKDGPISGDIWFEPYLNKQVTVKGVAYNGNASFIVEEISSN